MDAGNKRGLPDQPESTPLPKKAALDIKGEESEESPASGVL
jgi:hypothetical protein